MLTMSSEKVDDYNFHDFQSVTPVDDLDTTVAYYRDKLGFQVDFVVDGIHARVSKDKVMLQFATRRPEARDLTDGGYIHLGHVDGREDLDGLYAEYWAKGVKITMEPTIQSWGLREFEIEDCNGRRLRFAVDAPSSQ